MLEGILTHARGLPAHVVDEVRRYTKLFWINSGPHNGVTARKQLLRLTTDEWVRAVTAAGDGGAPLRTREGETAVAAGRAAGAGAVRSGRRSDSHAEDAG